MKLAIGVTLFAALMLAMAATATWASCGNAYTKCCETECYGGTCTTRCN